MKDQQRTPFTVRMGVDGETPMADPIAERMEDGTPSAESEPSTPEAELETAPTKETGQSSIPSTGEHMTQGFHSRQDRDYGPYLLLSWPS